MRFCGLGNGPAVIRTVGEWVAILEDRGSWWTLLLLCCLRCRPVCGLVLITGKYRCRCHRSPVFCPSILDRLVRRMVDLRLLRLGLRCMDTYVSRLYST